MAGELIDAGDRVTEAYQRAGHASDRRTQLEHRRAGGGAPPWICSELAVGGQRPVDRDGAPVGSDLAGRRPAAHPSARSTMPLAESAADLGEQLGVVGDAAAKLHRQRRAARAPARGRRRGSRRAARGAAAWNASIASTHGGPSPRRAKRTWRTCVRRRPRPAATAPAAAAAAAARASSGSGRLLVGSSPTRPRSRRLGVGRDGLRRRDRRQRPRSPPTAAAGRASRGAARRTATAGPAATAHAGGAGAGRLGRPGRRGRCRWPPVRSPFPFPLPFAAAAADARALAPQPDLARERLGPACDAPRPSPRPQSASSDASSPRWSTRPATSRIAPSRHVAAVCSYDLREDDDLDRALQVLERRDAHRRLGLRDDRPRRR